MQRARPAPLFAAALAFGVGCWLGLAWYGDSWCWLAACGGLFVLWLAFLVLARTESPWRLALAYFFLLLLAGVVGGFHGSLRERVSDPLDVRALPAEKQNPRSQWRGEVTGDPRFRPRKDRDDSGRTTLVLDLSDWRSATDASEDKPWQPVRGLVQVRVDGSAPEAFHYGDTVELTGGLEEPSAPLNPGQFDVANYLRQRDIYCQIVAKSSDVRVLAAGGGDWLTRLAWRARDWSLAQLRLGLENDPAISSLLAGMLIGYVEGVPTEIETAFRNTGTYHVFAVSGQNVAVICGVGLVALQLMGLVRWRWGWLLVPLLVFYCLITGGQPSAVRALLMAVLVLFAWSLERPVSVLNLWSLALLLVLGFDPKLVLNLSFQLSFAVVGALILLTPPIFNGLERLCGLHEEEVDEDDPDAELLPPLPRPAWVEFVRKWVRSALLLVASSLAAWLGSLPLMAYYFHQVAWIGLVANLFVVPLAGVIVVVGSIAVGLAPLSTALAGAVNNANWLLAKGLVWMVTTFAQVPGACVYAPDWSVAWRPTEPEFVCTAASGGTALLIRYGEKAWLVNTGTESQFKYVTNPLRKFYGVNRLESVVISELGALQGGGALALWSEGMVREWSTPPRQKITKGLQPWLDVVQRTGSELQVWSRGHEETLAPGFTVTVLSPGEDNRAQRMEDRGLVLLFRYATTRGERTLLYAGRIGSRTEAELLEQALPVEAEVLVQGAHGKESNLELDWLHAVKPREVIISAPSPYATERMDSIELLPEEERPRVWRQESCGAVTVRLKADGVEVVPFIRSAAP